MKIWEGKEGLTVPVSKLAVWQDHFDAVSIFHGRELNPAHQGLFPIHTTASHILDYSTTIQVPTIILVTEFFQKQF